MLYGLYRQGVQCQGWYAKITTTPDFCKRCSAALWRENFQGNSEPNAWVGPNCIFTIFSVCEMNVHKRCQTNVGNNCGVKTKEIAQMLAEIGKNAHDIKNMQKKVSMKYTTNEPFIKTPTLAVQ
jgi:hypothetical protein